MMDARLGILLGLLAVPLAKRLAGSATKRSVRSRQDEAIKVYGETWSASDAGYILSDGRMVDFSEGGGMGRTLDHRNIGHLLSPEEEVPDHEYGSSTKNMIRWMGLAHAMRVNYSGTFCSVSFPEDQAAFDAVTESTGMRALERFLRGAEAVRLGRFDRGAVDLDPYRPSELRAAVASLRGGSALRRAPALMRSDVPDEFRDQVLGFVDAVRLVRRGLVEGPVPGQSFADYRRDVERFAREVVGDIGTDRPGPPMQSKREEIEAVVTAALGVSLAWPDGYTTPAYPEAWGSFDEHVHAIIGWKERAVRGSTLRRQPLDPRSGDFSDLRYFKVHKSTIGFHNFGNIIFPVDREKNRIADFFWDVRLKETMDGWIVLKQPILNITSHDDFGPKRGKHKQEQPPPGVPGLGLLCKYYDDALKKEREAYLKGWFTTVPAFLEERKRMGLAEEQEELLRKEISNLPVTEVV